MGELLSIDRTVSAEQVRRHFLRVAEAHEASIVTAPTTIMPNERIKPDIPPSDGPIFVGIGGGYVRGRDQNWFEVIAGKSLISFHRDGRVPDPPSGFAVWAGVEI